MSSRGSNIHLKNITMTEDMSYQAGQIIPVKSKRQVRDWPILVGSVKKMINVHNFEVLEFILHAYIDNLY